MDKITRRGFLARVFGTALVVALPAQKSFTDVRIVDRCMSAEEVRQDFVRSASSDGKWHHYTIRFDGKADHIYIDGRRSS